MRTQNAVTMISLVITIIVILILAGISISMLAGENGMISNAQKSTLNVRGGTVKEKIDLFYLENNISDLEEVNNKSIDDLLKDLISEELLYENEIDYYNEKIVIGDIEIDLINKLNILDGWSDEEKVNIPVLTDGMIPIKWNNTNWEICSVEDPDWYDYQNKNWANIMLSDGTYKDGENAEIGQIININELGSMFVWIPRYSYSINEYKVNKNGEGSTQEIFDINFLMGKSNVDEFDITYATDYDIDLVTAGEKTPSIIHPAFNFDGKEITGFWTAKFEASNSFNYIAIKPNASSWKNIQFSTIVTNCILMNMSNNIYKLDSNSNTHLIKNTEWGAVSYLASSEYGFIPAINSSYFTTANGNYQQFVTQSTTGNITGIYDLNGGASEYVAAFSNNSNDILTTNGSNIYFENNTIKPEYEKYFNIYDVSDLEVIEMNNGLWDKDASANNIRSKIIKENFELLKNIKGDAMYETLSSTSYSYYGKTSANTYNWLSITTNLEYREKNLYNSDYALIGYGKNPFIIRGGYGWSGSDAGIFAIAYIDGGMQQTRGFRPTIVSY